MGKKKNYIIKTACGLALLIFGVILLAFLSIIIVKLAEFFYWLFISGLAVKLIISILSVVLVIIAFFGFFYICYKIGGKFNKLINKK